MIPRFMLLAASLAAFATVASSQVPLSKYLGAPSGTVKRGANRPFMVMRSITDAGIGVDCIGDPTRRKIEFQGRGTLAHGIGMRPAYGKDASVIEFDLHAIARDLGQTPTHFSAVVGMHPKSRSLLGTRFEVWLDNLLAAQIDIASPSAPSKAFKIALNNNPRTMTLKTSPFGRELVLARDACWGLATLGMPWSLEAKPSTVKRGGVFELIAGLGPRNNIAAPIILSINGQDVAPIPWPVTRVQANGLTGTRFPVPRLLSPATFGFEYWMLGPRWTIVRSNRVTVRITR